MGQRIGKHDRLLRFERNTESGDGVNAVESWAALVNLYGGRKFPQGGAGSWNHAENQDLPDEVLHFRCRWFDGLSTETDRFLLDGVYYELLVIEEIGRKEALHLVAKKRVDA